jgi:hypothetical protein
MYNLLELSRRSLEAVYGVDQLISVPESRLEEITDPDTRDVMRTLGLPMRRNPMFGLDGELGERFIGIGQTYEWELVERYDDVPLGSDRWVHLCDITDDSIVLDPGTGKIHCLPQDGEIYFFSTSFRHYVHFMYIYESQLPYFDFEEGDDDLWDPQGARVRVEEAFRAVDPIALENPQSRWHDVLTFIVDPEYDY